MRTVNSVLLESVARGPEGDTDVQILAARAHTPPPWTREHHDFIVDTSIGDCTVKRGDTNGHTTWAMHHTRPSEYSFCLPARHTVSACLTIMDFTKLDISDCMLGHMRPRAQSPLTQSMTTRH